MKVILSTDSNINYSVFAPITTLVWKKIAGYDPVIIFVNNNSNTPTEYAINEAKSLGAQVFEINAVEGYRTGTSSQLSRIFVGCLDLPSECYCLTSDIDMWSLQRFYFHQQDWNKEVHIFFSNANNHKTYPICYLGMKHKIWQDVMQVKKGSITEAMRNQMSQDLGPNPDSTKEWMYDEYLFETRLRHWPNYKNRTQYMNRDMRNGVYGRLDRSNWRWRGWNDSYIDSHVLRPLYFPQNWEPLKELLRQILNHEDFEYCVRYHSKMLELTKGMF